MAKPKSDTDVVALPSCLRELVQRLNRDAPELASKTEEHAEWFRFAVVLSLLGAAGELIATDPDYNGRIGAALRLAEKAVEVQRSEGAYREQARKSGMCS
jgi:hypothetical protein